MRLTDRDQRKIGYTGDTGPTAPLVQFFKGVNLLVSEATLLEPGARSIEARGSLTAAEAGRLAREAGASTLLLTHMWEELGFSIYASQAAEEFAGQIEIAHPGLTLSI
jgi:ribonuclease Z